MEKVPFCFKFHAMGAENEIQICSDNFDYARNAADCAIAEVYRIEQKYSRYLADSVVSKINVLAGGGPVMVDSETAGLLSYADACFNQSGGLFDLTSGVLRRAWNFTDQVFPQADQIRSLLPLVGWEKVSWKNPYIILPREGMELDFGGIGKEYAVDRAAAILIERGFTHALVNLSGDIRACGPQSDGSPWSVGITDSRDGVSILGAVAIQSGAVATSGNYERVIVIDGKRYSHILNPRTGWPTQGIQSVTVFTDSCLVAGSITTTGMLHGKKGQDYLEEVGVPYVMVTSEGSVRYSKGLSRLFARPSR